MLKFSFCSQSRKDFEKVNKDKAQSLSLCVCLDGCLSVRHQAYISETNEAVAIKFDCLSYANVSRFNYTDVNHENNKCLIIIFLETVQAMPIKFAVKIVPTNSLYICFQSDDLDL